MSSRTPPLYATGRWSVKAPFEVKNDAIYTCKAIRSIDDLEARGIDPYEVFYQPLGITRATYEQDLVNLVNIVTLMSDTERLVYVPDTYILSYPDVTTVPYSHVVMSISLGAVADGLALEDFQAKVEEMMEATIGIKGEVKIHRSGTTAAGVEQGTHRTLESNRKARIENNVTNYARALSVEEELERLRIQATELERIVIENGLLG